MDQRFTIIKASPYVYGAAIAGAVMMFLLVSIVGPAHSAFMDKDSTGKMTSCIFTGAATFCRMRIVEHIARWQGMLVAAFTKSSPALFSLWGVAFLIVTLWGRVLPSASDPWIATRSGRRLSLLNFVFPFLNPLARAFARGILHPRIYENVYI